MKKFTKLLTMAMALVLSVSVLTACSSGSSATKTEQEPIESSEESGTHIVVDALGREVEVPLNPQKIALPVMVTPHMVYALQGHMNNVISIAPSGYSGWEISMLRYLAPELEGVDTTMVGDDYSVNIEALVEEGCDLVINLVSQTDIAEQLEAVGIPCVLVKIGTNFEEIKAYTKLMGDALNCGERTEQAIAWYEETEAYFESKADEIAALPEEEQPRVLNFLRTFQTQTYSSGMNLEITEFSGGQKFEFSADVTTPTMEDILKFDPEIIFLSNFDDAVPEDLYENRIEGQNWEGVSAVENKRVYKVPAGLYRWSPPVSFEKPLYMLWSAQIVQPEIFNDYDMRSEVSDFYKEYYNYELSEEQLDEIFRLEANASSSPIGK